MVENLDEVLYIEINEILDEVEDEKIVQVVKDEVDEVEHELLDEMVVLWLVIVLIDDVEEIENVAV